MGICHRVVDNFLFHRSLLLEFTEERLQAGDDDRIRKEEGVISILAIILSFSGSSDMFGCTNPKNLLQLFID